MCEHSLYHVARAVSIATRAQGLSQIHADVTQLRVVLERPAPQPYRSSDHAAMRVEHAEIGRRHRPVWIQRQDLLVHLLGGRCVASGLAQISQPDQHLDIVGMLPARRFQQAQGFAGRVGLTAQRQFAVGEAEIAGVRRRISELHELADGSAPRKVVVASGPHDPMVGDGRYD